MQVLLLYMWNELWLMFLENIWCFKYIMFLERFINKYLFLINIKLHKSFIYVANVNTLNTFNEVNLQISILKSVFYHSIMIIQNTTSIMTSINKIHLDFIWANYIFVLAKFFIHLKNFMMISFIFKFNSKSFIVSKKNKKHCFQYLSLKCEERLHALQHFY